MPANQGSGPHIQTVILVGTNHTFQRPVNGPHAAGIAEFRNMITDLCYRYNIAGIAEEMSWYALQEWNVAESVPQQVCTLLGLHHQLSDPSPEERNNLGIIQDNDIRAEHMFDKWTQEQVEADILARGSGPSDRIREQFWLKKIQKLNVWPLLFICGANHFTSFDSLLKASYINVVEAHRDWEPTTSGGGEKRYTPPIFL